MQTITFTSPIHGTYNVPATPASVHHQLAPVVVETRPPTRRRRKLIHRRARAWARAAEFAQADRVLTVDEPAGCERADARHEAECAEYRVLATLCLDGLTLGELAWVGRALGTPRWYGGRDYGEEKARVHLAA